MASLALKLSPSPSLERSKLQGMRPSARPSLLIVAKKANKIQTSQPYGPAGGVVFKEGVDASGRGKGVYQFSNKYGENVDGPVYTPEEWSSSGDVYVGGKRKLAYRNKNVYIRHCFFNVSEDVYGKTGLFLWAVTLAGILLGGALLIYSTSALAS